MSNSLAVCPTCLQRIVENVSIEVKELGRKYHRQCFRCFKCAKLLDEKLFYFHRRRQDEPESARHQPHCGECFAVWYMPDCNGCGKRIEAGDIYWLACRVAWHTKCFRCSKCGRALPKNEFDEIKNHPVCRQCPKSKTTTGAGEKDQRAEK